MKAISLVIAFILEVVAFIGFADLGFLFSVSHLTRVVILVVLLVLLSVFWGLFMGPKAPKKFKVVPYYISKIVIYGVAALVIFEKQPTLWGLIFVAVAILDELALFKHNTAT